MSGFGSADTALSRRTGDTPARLGLDFAAASVNNLPMKFLDQCKIYIRSGDGAAGVSFRARSFIEIMAVRNGASGRGGDGDRTARAEHADRLSLPPAFQAKTGVMHGSQPLRRGRRRRLLKGPVGTQVEVEGPGEPDRRSRPGCMRCFWRGGNEDFCKHPFQGAVNQRRARQSGLRAREMDLAAPQADRRRGHRRPSQRSRNPSSPPPRPRRRISPTIPSPP